MSAVLPAAPENPLRSAPDPFAALASSESHHQERVPARDQFAPDIALPTSRIVPPPPAAHDSGASLHRCPHEWFSSLPPHGQSTPASPSKRVQRSSGVLPASSACIPTAPHAATGPLTGRLRCPQVHLLACPQDPAPKPLTHYSWSIR